METSGVSDLLTVEEAGEMLGVSVSTVWRLLRRGALPGIRRGGRRWIARRDVEARLAARPASDAVPALTEEHPIFDLVGAGKSGGSKPGARDKHAILDG